MEVTRRPQALRTTPILLAVTPLPSPLTTPPVTSTYFILSVFCLCEIVVTETAALGFRINRLVWENVRQMLVLMPERENMYVSS